MITQISAAAKYYFGRLEGVDGGDGAQCPTGRHLTVSVRF